MKTIIDKLNLEMYQSKAYSKYFNNKNFAVFDIETTGLSPKKAKIILSGILIHKYDHFEAIQYFANNQVDEKEIIEKTLEIFNKVDYIITFNGKHFDIPFLVNRAQAHNIKIDHLPYNLDLYLIANGHSDLKEYLPNLKQKTIEMFMGLSDDREDLISGKESVEMYNKYLVTKNSSLEESILLHNHDDIIQLYRIMPLLNKCDFHRAMFKLGFTVKNFDIKKIQIKGHDIYITGKQISSPIDYMSFPSVEKPYSLNMNSYSSSFELVIPGQCEAGAIFFDAQSISENALSEIEKYPSVTNGYLIVKNNTITNYMEINMFLIAFFNKLVLI